MQNSRMTNRLSGRLETAAADPLGIGPPSLNSAVGRSWLRRKGEKWLIRLKSSKGFYADPLSPDPTARYTGSNSR